MKRDLQILGSGSYLPENEYTSEYLDNLLGLPSGTSYKTSRIKKRYWISTETATEMAVSATKEALKVAKLTIDALDLIVSACGTPIQIIPYNAVLIQEKLGLQRSGIPCFDVNSSCLSFITGLDIISHLISNGVYNRILLVSTDISSVGLNRNDLQTFANFGDGASAFIISKGDGSSSITSSHFETYSEGVHDTEVIGGGNLVHASNYVNFGEETFLFRMNGSKVFKLTLKKIKGFLEAACQKESKSFKQCLEECSIVIPHQASYRALELTRQFLSIPREKFANEIENYGNMIAVSIPFMLDRVIRQGKLKRGDKFMLIGTGAGLSLGFLKGIY